MSSRNSTDSQRKIRSSCTSIEVILAVGNSGLSDTVLPSESDMISSFGWSPSFSYLHEMLLNYFIFSAIFNCIACAQVSCSCTGVAFCMGNDENHGALILQKPSPKWGNVVSPMLFFPSPNIITNRCSCISHLRMIGLWHWVSQFFCPFRDFWWGKPWCFFRS